MKEKDWVEIDEANGRLIDAQRDVRKAYIKQIKRLEKQLEDCIETLKFYAEMEHCCDAFDYQGCGRDYWINDIENGIYLLEGYYPIEVGQKAKECIEKIKNTEN